MSKSFNRALLRSSSLIILISSSVTLSSAAFANGPLEVVVTADRSEVPLKNTGSAITVITSEEIEKYGSKNIADVLRTVPGLTISEAGGLGSAAKVQLRGASPGASMILLDGIRISDPSNTEGYFDFGNFSTSNVERIEILRGPQSALYGSDAMGGVINIITKKGKRLPVRELTLEGGSYGTYGARGAMSGATDTVSYSFGLNAMHSDGFPRYGYRINRPIFGSDYDGNPWPLPKLPKDDPVDKAGINGNILYKISPDVSVETGLSYFANDLQFDNPYAYNPDHVFDAYNRSTADLVNGYVRGKFPAFNAALANQITAFANSTDLGIRQREGCFYPDYTTFDCKANYLGARAGGEYQGDINLGWLGAVSFGARSETEFSDSTQSPDYNDDNFLANSAQQTTNSLFINDRVAVTDRFDIGFGGRVDAIMDGQTFYTWRANATHRFDSSGTKLRSSIGSGAKAPSLFQRFSPYGTASLAPETSLGFDIGIEQDLFKGAGGLSLTYFNTDYDNKIMYVEDWWACLSNCYYNAGKVTAQGAEVALDLDLVPSKLRAKLSYTFTEAIDREKDQQLFRVPQHTGFVSLTYTGIPKWQFEPRLTIVGERLDTIGSVVKLPGYIRLDIENRYNVNNANDAYIRFENLTDAHTEDVYNFGSAGRSVYVGWTTRW